MPFVNGNAENECITRMRDLSCRCLHDVGGGMGEAGMNLARLYGMSTETEQEMYDYPVVTLLPHIEAPLEQLHVAELVC
jgi:hypothetical protein